MKKILAIFAFIGIIGYCNADEYCDMGICFDLGSFEARTLHDDSGEPITIKANKGVFTSMAVSKGWQQELSLEEKIDLLKTNLDKNLRNQTRGTLYTYSIKFSEAEENLGMINAYCLTALVKMGFGATQYKFYIFKRDNVSYLAEFSTPGGVKGFEKSFRAMIDSFYMMH